MQIKNLNKREKRIAFVTLMLAVFAVLYGFIIEPISGKWHSIDNEMAARTNVLKRDMLLSASYNTLESQYFKVAKFAKSSRSEEEEVADILTYIENVSQKNQCLIINIKPIGTKRYGSYKEVLIDITAEGDMSKFSKFLYDIENPRTTLLGVKRFTLTSKSSQPGLLRGSFLISKMFVE